MNLRFYHNALEEETLRLWQIAAFRLTQVPRSLVMVQIILEDFPLSSLSSLISKTNKERQVQLPLWFSHSKMTFKCREVQTFKL
jgi:hypothetical protein